MRRVVQGLIAGEQPVVDQADAGDVKWIDAGGDPRDRGRFVELISGRLTGSERMLVGIAWSSPATYTSSTITPTPTSGTT